MSGLHESEGVGGGGSMGGAGGDVGTPLHFGQFFLTSTTAGGAPRGAAAAAAAAAACGGKKTKYCGSFSPGIPYPGWRMPPNSGDNIHVPPLVGSQVRHNGFEDGEGGMRYGGYVGVDEHAEEV